MTLKFVMQKVRHVPSRVVKRVRERGVGDAWSWFRYQLAWRRRERRLGINTAEHAYGLDVYGRDGGQYYDPIDYRCCEIALDYLQPSPDDVLLDYGCGLGRAIILAAERPFRRVVGVEIHEQLVDYCRQHVASARARGQLQCEVEVVHQDAAEYPVPHDVNRVLVYNAFVDQKLLDRVLARVRQSLDEHPRELVLVYAPLLPSADWLDACPWLRRRCELPTGYWDHVAMRVYAAVEEAGGSAPAAAR